MISFIQVIDVLRTFSQGHLQLQKFDFEFREQMPNFATIDEAYPILYVVPVGTVNVQFGKEFELDIYCVDRYKKDRSNVGYVISDTELILSDLSVYLENQTVFDSSYGNTTPINNDLLDYAGGHVMRIRVTVEKQALCEIPFDGEQPTPPTCPSALVRNSDGSWSEIVPSGATYTLPDTPVTVVDSNGGVLFTVDTISVTGGNVTAPDATYLVEYENGTPIQSGSILSGGNEVVQVPNPIVCADGVVNVNGTLFDTVASGGTIDIQVYKSTGNDQIGSKQGQFWRIPNSTAVLKDSAGNTLSTMSIKATESEDITAPDVDLEINSVAVDSFASGSTIDFQLTDGVNPVTPTSVTVVGNVVTAEVAAGGVIQRSTAKNMQTGQVTSYGSNDDADSRLTVGRLDDFMTLDAAPVHNDGSATINTTTNRFTDILGGQTYTDNIVLDWSTWNGSTLLGYYRLPNATNVDWDAARVAANGYSIGSFSSGWGVPNRGEYFSICKHEGTTLNYPLNYAPFNISLATVFLTSTTPAGSTANCFTVTNNASANFGNQLKTGLGRFIARRQFTLSTSNILS